MTSHKDPDRQRCYLRTEVADERVDTALETIS